jgi:hypothetical protein
VTLLQPREVVRVLLDAGVEFVVVGGRRSWGVWKDKAVEVELRAIRERLQGG